MLSKGGKAKASSIKPKPMLRPGVTRLRPRPVGHKAKAKALSIKAKAWSHKTKTEI